MAVVTELLRSVAIFKDLDTGELARVAEVCREQTFASGEYIFREGEAGNRLFLIVEGEVRISRDVPGSGEDALAILKPGAMFGEMAVFDRSERSTDAISKDRKSTRLNSSHGYISYAVFCLKKKTNAQIIHL